MSDELSGLGLDQADTQANFAWLSLGDRLELDVMRALAERGVAVRPGEGLGAPGHLRVTYGTRAENEAFVEALREIIGS